MIRGLMASSRSEAVALSPALFHVMIVRPAALLVLCFYAVDYELVDALECDIV